MRYTKPILLLTLLLLSLPLEARRVSTRHSGKKRVYTHTAASTLPEVECRELADSTDYRSAIRFFGYDKPLTATTESLFIANGSPLTLSRAVVTITYRTLDGTQLHKRSVTLRPQAPGGETRMVTFRSFDTHQTFCYRLSNHPKRRQYTPYDITLSADSLFFLQP